MVARDAPMSEKVTIRWKVGVIAPEDPRQKHVTPARRPRSVWSIDDDKMPPPPPAQTRSDIVSQLSITGISLICNPGAFWLRRAAWFLVISGLLVWLCFQLKDCISRATAGGTTRHWSTHVFTEVPVPAITVCHGNVFKKSQVLRFTNAGVTWKDFRHQSFKTLNWSSMGDIGQFYRDVVYRWKDIMIWCEVQGKMCSDVGTMKPIPTLSYGLCITFMTNTTVKKRATTGQVILAFNESEQLNNYEHSGWWVHLHSKQVMFDEISVFTGQTKWIKVAAKKWYNIKLSTIRKQMLPSTAGCSEADDAEMRYNECLGSCAAKNLNMTKTCKIPWFGFPYPEEMRYCRTLADLAANSPSHHSLEEETFLEITASCQCAPPCRLEQYRISQQDVWPLEETTVYQDLPWLLGMNASRVDLSLDSVAQVIVEKEAYSFQTFISEVGGSLGLMLGGSLLTFVEIIDCMVTACYARRGKQW